MNADKVRSYLETATSTVVLVVVTLIASTLAWGFIAQQQSSPNVRNGLHKGEAFTAVPPVSLGSASRTLVLAMNSKCGYCNESVPFYERIIDAAYRSNKVQVVAISSEEDNLFKNYLSRAQLKINSRSSVDMASHGIAATPTIIMIDDKGRVLDFWVGKLSQEGEEQVIKAITSDGID